jgi:hypothetical protein
MSYEDIYLKFVDEGDAMDKLFIDGKPLLQNIDLVGVFEGVDGYHVNVRLSDDETVPGSAGNNVISPPKTPKRVWL